MRSIWRKFGANNQGFGTGFGYRHWSLGREDHGVASIGDLLVNLAAERAACSENGRFADNPTQIRLESLVKSLARGGSAAYK